MYKVFYYVLLLESLFFMTNHKAGSRYISQPYLGRLNKPGILGDSSYLDFSDEVRGPSNEKQILLKRLRRISGEDELLSDVRKINWLRGLSYEKLKKPGFENGFRHKRYFLPNTLEEPVFSFNLQKLPQPSNNIGVLETATDSENLKKSSSESTISKTLTGDRSNSEGSLDLSEDRKTDPVENTQKRSIRSSGDHDDAYDSIIGSLKIILEKTEQMKKEKESESDKGTTKIKRRTINNKERTPLNELPKLKSFLDFSNSQVPFNEGNPKFRSSDPEYFAFMNQDVHQINQEEVPDKIRQKRNDEMKMIIRPYKGESDADLKVRVSVEIQKRLNELLGRKNGNQMLHPYFDYFKYSRIRRNSRDQEKKEKRHDSKPHNLEAKELAMERVLDPNLNVEGILEPHVRLRRDERH